MQQDHQTGFDDEGQRVLSVGFEYPEQDVADESQAAGDTADVAGRDELFGAFIDRIIFGGAGNSIVVPNATQVGRRALALGYVLRRGKLQNLTQRELANRLGIHESMASKLVTAMKAELRR